MTKSRDITFSVVAALGLFVAIEFVPLSDTVFLVLGGLLLLIALMRGRRLPLMVRVFTTAFIVYWAYIACLIGRTMQPGLTGYTVGMALTFFAIFGWWPGIALFRLWRTMAATAMLCALLPVAFTLAALVASTEEYLFVCKYRESGVGTTPRWTVSNHWLSYDKDAQSVAGSD